MWKFPNTIKELIQRALGVLFYNARNTKTTKLVPFWNRQPVDMKGVNIQNKTLRLSKLVKYLEAYLEWGILKEWFREVGVCTWGAQTACGILLYTTVIQLMLYEALVRRRTNRSTPYVVLLDLAIEAQARLEPRKC